MLYPLTCVPLIFLSSANPVISTLVTGFHYNSHKNYYLPVHILKHGVHITHIFPPNFHLRLLYFYLL